jgi:hypothetical protein
MLLEIKHIHRRSIPVDAGGPRRRRAIHIGLLAHNANQT